MPSKPRPKQLSNWFQYSRRRFGKGDVPKIESIKVFETEWVKWWSAAQPPWRDTRSWPFERVSTAGDWGKLPNGGKDGLYLVMISLGWWINARDPSNDSMLNDAIADVTSVIDNLVSFLAREITAADGGESEPEPEPSPSIPSPTPSRKRRQSIKIGPPPKRNRARR
jgi:hypothetical protein